MIDIREWSDETLEALAQIAEQDGRKEAAARLRATIKQREKDRADLKKEMARRGW